MSEGLPVSGVLLQVDESEVNPPQNTQNFEYFLPRDDFSVVRQLYLDHLGDPGDSVATVDAKKTFFRYGIYNHASTRRGGRTHGKAWDFGDIFHVAHDPSQIPWSVNRVVTWNDAVRFWADVTMHELGHTLGLRHGGHDDNAYKPNYFSVMSYMGGLDHFDTPGHDRVLNYSELPNTLDELNLDERVPVLPLGSPDYAMSWSCPSPAMTLVQAPGRATNGVDWNCDSSSSGFVGALDVDQSRVCVKAAKNAPLAAVFQGDDIVVGGRIMRGPDGVLNTWPMAMGDVAVNGEILAGSDNILNTVPHEDDVVVDQWIMDGGNRICDSAAAGDDVTVRPVNSEQERFIEAWNDWEHLRIPLKGNGVSGAFENVEVELSPEEWIRMGEERNLSDLVLTATESLGVGRLGRSVALTYVVSNSGPNAAILPMINLHLPPGVDLVACGAELGNCQQIGNVVAVTVDHLLVGEEAVVVIEVAVDCTVAPGSKLEFVATLESRSRDLARESNVVSMTVSPVSFLGFEDASRPWVTSPGGSPVPTTNVNVSDGNSALSLACGYRQFESPTFDTVELGSVGPELSVDVYVPNVQSPWVGELALIVDIPSGQLWDRWINQVNLGALPLGSWQTVTFMLPPEVVAVLAGNFPDARIKLALNHGLCGSDVLVDKVRFSGQLTCQQPSGTLPQQISSGVLTFDQASDWTATGTTISPSLLTTQGTGAIALAPTHSARLSSRNFHTGELMGVTSRLGFDVHIPDLPPDYYWFGGMNAFVECPSAGLWNAHLGYRALQILFDGEYNRLEFDLPPNVASVLQGSYTDCRFHLDIATNPALGPIGIDNGGFVQ